MNPKTSPPNATTPSLAPAPRASRAFLFGAVALPIILSAIYAVVLPSVPAEDQAWFNGEDGPVEIITAFLFLAAGVIAALLARKLPRQGETGIPKWSIALFWFIALGSFFMFAEEISWGQHLFNWSSPDFFTTHNKQYETNLHNLAGDTPSRLIRRVGEIGLPIFALLLPLIFALGKNSWHPGHWPRYVIPRWELSVWITLAVLIRPVRKWIEANWPGEYRSSLSEFQELLWAGALILYLAIMWRRLIPPPDTQRTQ